MDTLAGLIVPAVRADGYVAVDMGYPIFEPAKVIQSPIPHDSITRLMQQHTLTDSYRLIPLLRHNIPTCNWGSHNFKTNIYGNVTVVVTQVTFSLPNLVHIAGKSRELSRTRSQDEVAHALVV